VMKAPLGGGTPVTLATAPGAGFGIAVDATHVYWSTSGTVSRITKVPLNGGASSTLATEGGLGIAVDAQNVYFTTTDSVKKVPLGGGTPITLATGQDVPTFIAVDATSVYWTNAGSGPVPSGSVMKLTPK
jgi:hypothetical protein